MFSKSLTSASKTLKMTASTGSPPKSCLKQAPSSGLSEASTAASARSSISRASIVTSEDCSPPCVLQRGIVEKKAVAKKLQFNDVVVRILFMCPKGNKMMPVSRRGRAVRPGAGHGQQSLVHSTGSASASEAAAAAALVGRDPNIMTRAADETQESWRNRIRKVLDC